MMSSGVSWLSRRRKPSLKTVTKARARQGAPARDHPTHHPVPRQEPWAQGRDSCIVL